MRDLFSHGFVEENARLSGDQETLYGHDLILMILIRYDVKL